MNILSKELKQLVLSDDSQLDEATKELKNQIESDLEGDFKMEKYRDLRQDRKAIMTGAVTGVKQRISTVQSLRDTVEGREEDAGFKKDRRRDTISNTDYNDVKKAMENYKFLYQHFATMFYAENRFNDKISSVVDLQKSRQLQHQNLELVQDSIPTVIENAFQESERLNELEKTIEEVKELADQSGDEEIVELKSRISELEQELEKARRDMDQAKSNSSGLTDHIGTEDDSPKTSEEEEEDDLDTVPVNKLSEDVDLTDMQEELTKILDRKDIEDLEELADELNRPPIAVKSIISGLQNKASNEGIKSEVLGSVMG